MSEIIDSLLDRAKEMLKGDNSREISAEEIITILKEYKKLQKENENYKKLILDIKEKLNNIQFEVEQTWRKIEKLENKYE